MVSSTCTGAIKIKSPPKIISPRILFLTSQSYTHGTIRYEMVQLVLRLPKFKMQCNVKINSKV